MLITRLLGKEQAGDTIIEVLIAIAIVGTILLGAYITTGKNVASIQDAQERTQALKLAEGQAESLRAATSITASTNCFQAGVQKQATNIAGNDPCVVDATGAQAAAGVQPAYKLRVSNAGIGSPYVVTVDWDRSSGSGRNTVTLYVGRAYAG
jgi:prepilin-type N-terminal cleavage/methylation domain-containing protein